MTDLRFAVTGVRPDPYAAAPVLGFRLRIEESAGAAIAAIALRCQIRIEPQRRRYSADEAATLLELFGETPRWGDTLKPFLWTNVTAMVQAFVGSVDMELPVPCTYDFEIAAAKYLHALRDGEVPLLFLFSGTIFTKGEGGLSVTQVPWDKEARYGLPASAWRDLMNLYYPDSGWLRLRRDTLDALLRFKATRVLATFDDVVAALLAAAEGQAA